MLDKRWSMGCNDGNERVFYYCSHCNLANCNYTAIMDFVWRCMFLNVSNKEHKSCISTPLHHMCENWVIARSITYRYSAVAHKNIFIYDVMPESTSTIYTYNLYLIKIVTNTFPACSSTIDVCIFIACLSIILYSNFICDKWHVF